KSGSPISRWMTSRPCASSMRAWASTSNAPSVPSRDMRSAKRRVISQGGSPPPRSGGGAACAHPAQTDERSSRGDPHRRGLAARLLRAHLEALDAGSEGPAVKPLDQRLDRGPAALGDALDGAVG